MRKPPENPQFGRREFLGRSLALLTFVTAGISTTTNDAVAKLLETLEQDAENNIDLQRSLHHQEAFDELTNLALQAAPHLNSQQKITLLYPGAGSHLGPLKSAENLFENTEVMEVELIYTDIDDNSRIKLENYLGNLSVKGELKLQSRMQNILNGGREFVSEFEYLSKNGAVKKLTLRYALNCSDTKKGDHPYFRSEYGNNADILISHDSSNELGHSHFQSAFLISALKPNSKKVFFLEDNHFKSRKTPSTNWNILPGRVTFVDREYGCRDDDPQLAKEHDHMGPAFFKAAFFEPDMNILSKLTPEEIKAVAFMANQVEYFDSSTYSADEQTFNENKLPEIVKTYLAVAKKLETEFPGYSAELYANLIRVEASLANSNMNTSQMCSFQESIQCTLAYLEKSKDLKDPLLSMPYPHELIIDLYSLFLELKTKPQNSLLNISSLENEMKIKHRMWNQIALYAEQSGEIRERFRELIKVYFYSLLKNREIINKRFYTKENMKAQAAERSASLGPIIDPPVDVKEIKILMEILEDYIWQISALACSLDIPGASDIYPQNFCNPPMKVYQTTIDDLHK